MSNIITLTNEFCKAPFKLIKLVEVDDVENDNNRKEPLYKVANIKAIHWKLIFMEIGKVNSFDKNKNTYDLHKYERKEIIDSLKLKKKYTLSELYNIVQELSNIKFRVPLENKDVHTFYPIPALIQNTNEGLISIQLCEAFRRYLQIGDVRDDNNENSINVGGFTQFDYDILMSLDNVYAIRLYLYLSVYKVFPTTNIKIETLYDLLGVHKDYSIKNFTTKILKKACDEINKKTDINVIPMSKNRANSRKITSITFTIQSKALVQKELNKDLLIKSFIERQSLKMPAPDVMKQMELYVEMIKNTLDGISKEKVLEEDIYKAIGYCGGDIKMAGNLFGQAIKEKAGSKIGYIRAQAKKESIKPLKMFK